MLTPNHPTEDQIIGIARYHEVEAEAFAKHGQIRLSLWSKETAREWRRKLPSPVKNPDLPSHAELIAERRARARDAKGGDDGREI